MTKSQTLFRIKESQRRWADANIGEQDRGSVVRLEDNLYQPLTPQTRAQYERGDGDELGSFPPRMSCVILRGGDSPFQCGSC